MAILLQHKIWDELTKLKSEAENLTLKKKILISIILQ
jgi:hypothetical protein